MKALVTRPRTEAERMRVRLALAGHEAVLSPLFRIEPIKYMAPSGPFDAVVGASANAFRFLPRPAIAPLAGLPVYAVGARTAEAARQAGFSLIAEVAATAEALVARMAGSVKGQRVLYLAGAERKPAMEHGLAAAGADLALVETYRTVAATAFSAEAREALGTHGLDAALHFSRRSAELFTRLAAREGLVHEAAALRHLCLSEDVARGLRDLAPPSIAWPAHPRMEELLALL